MFTHLIRSPVCVDSFRPMNLVLVFCIVFKHIVIEWRISSSEAMDFSEMVYEDVGSIRLDEARHISENKPLYLLLGFSTYKHGNINGFLFSFLYRARK